MKTFLNQSNEMPHGQVGFSSRKGKFLMKRNARQIKSSILAVLALALVAAGLTANPAAAAGDRTLIIHYSRTTLNVNGTAANAYCDEDPCGIYDGWNLWLWQTGASDSSGENGFLFDAEQDNYGVKATIPVTNRTSTKVGFIVRLGSNWSTAKADVSDDRFINMNATGTTEVWLKQDDPMIYTSNPNDRVLRIHYNRSDNKYTGWDIFTQEEDSANNVSVAFSTKDDCFGRVASLNLPDITQTTQDFILRKGGNALTYKSRVFTATLSEKKYTDIWINANLWEGEDITIDDGDQTFLDLTADSQNPSGNLIAIHYSRPLKDYTGWAVKTLGDGVEHSLNITDSFGRIACAYEVNTDAKTTTVVVKKGSTMDLAFGESSAGLGGQRTVNITGPLTEVWLKQGSKTVFDKVIVPDVAIKQAQTLGKVPTSLKRGKSVALPMKTNAKLAVKWTVITPGICKITSGKLVAKSSGTCKLGAQQSGNAAYKLYTNQYRIAVS